MKIPSMAELVARLQTKPLRKPRIGRKTVWAYLNGKPVVDVLGLALDVNMMLDDVKRQLKAECPEVVFKVE